jgi:hypothetical protein
MEDGERLEGHIGSVNYYRDYKTKRMKSYIAETLGGLFKKED